MSDHAVQLVLMIVNTLTFVVLAWYAWETRKLRILAQGQLEALAKPCLTLRQRLRNGADAMLGIDGAIGNTVLDPDDASFVVRNIGNGVALNVRYAFKTGKSEPQERFDRYIQSVLDKQSMTLPEPINAFAGTYEIVFEFESIGGMAYRSSIKLDGHVVVGFEFRAL